MTNYMLQNSKQIVFEWYARLIVIMIIFINIKITIIATITILAFVCSQRCSCVYVMKWSNQATIGYLSSSTRVYTNQIARLLGKNFYKVAKTKVKIHSKKKSDQMYINILYSGDIQHRQFKIKLLSLNKMCHINQTFCFDKKNCATRLLFI